MTNYLENKKILIGITGGIAAYKVLDLIRRLREQGAFVKTILTENAKQFVTPVSIHALSGEPCVEGAMQHIELSRWADILLIAPATANFIGKAAHGLADDLLSSTYLASTAPTVIAPAMNLQMWQHKGTEDNLQQVKQHGTKVIGPASGKQACGECGPGRMLEADEILSELNKMFMPKILSGLSVLITAGPTFEAIDPVRYIGNHSSGKMGYALANAARQLGAKVTLISGPTSLQQPQQIEFISVTSAAEMLHAVIQNIEVAKPNIFIACAAVADYRPTNIAEHKLKKSVENLTLTLEPTVDILATVAKLDNPPFTVGFAAETENLLDNAKAKLMQKNLDIIIANNVADSAVFGEEFNQVVLVTKNAAPIDIPKQRKEVLAYDLLAATAAAYHT